MAVSVPVTDEIEDRTALVFDIRLDPDQRRVFIGGRRLP